MQTAGAELFDVETWQRALEQYGAVTGLTAAIYDSRRRLVLGPLPHTPLFDLLQSHGVEPGIVGDCIGQCLAASGPAPEVIVVRSYGMAVVGTTLRFAGEVVGAAVAGYALVDFCQASAIESLAHSVGIPFRPLWQAAIRVQPVPEQRLAMHGHLLNILCDTILREHHRTRQVQEIVASLEQRVDERTRELAAANRSLESEVRDRTEAEERIRKLLARLVVVREEERHRIARDIHDHLGQQLTALKLRLEVLPLLEAGSADFVEQLGYTQDLVGRLDADVASLTSDLRPLFVETLGLVRALASFVDEWGRVGGVAAHFSHAHELPTLTRDAELNIFRITQEALNNVSKHARATAVDIRLDASNGQIVLTVRDDGRGFVPGAATDGGGGMGLIGMGERAALIRGTLTIESAAGAGTSVRVAVPLDGGVAPGGREGLP